MPPKKAPPSPGTPRIRAFKFIKPTIPQKDEDKDDSSDDTRRRTTRPVRQIVTANAALKRKREMAENTEKSESGGKEQTTSNTQKPTRKELKSSAKKQADRDDSDVSTTDGPPVSKGKSVPKSVKQSAPPKTAGSKGKQDTEESDQSVPEKPTPAKGKSAKGSKKTKAVPSTSRTHQITDTEDSEVSTVDSSKMKPNQAPKKTTTTGKSSTTKSKGKGKSNHVPSKSKSGKKLTSKASIGNQPHEDDETQPDPTPPQDEAEYFASSDEDPREAQVKADAAMAKILQEDAVDSPLDYKDKKKYKRRQWTLSEDEAIIEHVKTHPIFYNKNRTDFIQRKKKNKLMEHLEPKLKLPGKTI